MIASEKIAEQLKNRKGNGIFDVEIDSDGYVRCQFENRIDPSQPYTLTVHPFAQERTLRIRIPLITLGPQDSPIPGLSFSTAISLINGVLRADSQSGISFELDHICQYDDGNDLSAELFGQLIDGMLTDFRQIETLTLHGQGMIEALMQIALNQSID